MGRKTTHFDDAHKKLREKVARHRRKPENQVKAWWQATVKSMLTPRKDQPPNAQPTFGVFEVLDDQGTPTAAVAAQVASPPAGVVRSTIVGGVYNVALARQLAAMRSEQITAIRAKVGL
jgi:hypothetical protein